MYTCICMHMYTYTTHVYIYAYTHVCIYIYICIHMYICNTHTHTHTHIYIYLIHVCTSGEHLGVSRWTTQGTDSTAHNLYPWLFCRRQTSIDWTHTTPTGHEPLAMHNKKYKIKNTVQITKYRIQYKLQSLQYK